MKILVFWDVYGRVGRNALKKELPKLKEKYNPDFIVVNVDNCTSWRGPIEKHILELESLGIDLMMWWDHVFDNIERVKDYLDREDSKLLRPANFYEHDKYKKPWKWYKILEKNGKRLLVVHLLWQVFMNYNVDNPFFTIEDILEKTKWENLDWIIIDFHKETTAEWYWMWFFLDGKISFIFGTHTHIQTNDELILPKGTWIISDVWMNWPLYSIIWADYKTVEKRFLSWIWRWKLSQCMDPNYVVNWVCVEIGDNMECKSIEKIRIRWKLV